MEIYKNPFSVKRAHKSTTSCVRVHVTTKRRRVDGHVRHSMRTEEEYGTNGIRLCIFYYGLDIENCSRRYRVPCGHDGNVRVVQDVEKQHTKGGGGDNGNQQSPVGHTGETCGRAAKARNIQISFVT